MISKAKATAREPIRTPHHGCGGVSDYLSHGIIMALCSQLFGGVRGAPPFQKLYPFYTLRGIAFGRVFAYSNFQENSMNIEAGGDAGLALESIIGILIAI